MEKISLLEVIEATNGRVIGSCDEANKFVEKAVSDSRVKMKNGLFFAIVGDNTDGHNYISMAKENGAVAVVVSKELDEYDAELVYILVDDTLKALKNLASWYRAKFSIPFVAITGSVGKTTTKEMIASVLKEKYNVLKTEGNLNSEIGAPLTILGLNNSHEIAVIEMGMDNLGQIYNISKIVKPDTAVISNIGVAHIEFLKTRENILKAKTEVFDNMDKNGVAILNIDDDMLSTIDNEMEKIWYGYSSKASIRALEVTVNYTEGLVCTKVLINGKEYMINIPGFSKNLVYAALTGIAVGLRYNMQITDIINGIESYQGIKMRMDVKKLSNGILLIDDTYNANPVSMGSLIDTVVATSKSVKTIIMGDMYELGAESLKGHMSVIEKAIELGISNVIVVGKNMKEAVENLTDEYKLKVKLYKTCEELYVELSDYIIPNSVVAVKASRGMKFENIVSKIIELI